MAEPTAARPPWHALLAPLPTDAVPTRQPVAPPELLASPSGSAVQGWEQLVLYLSAGDFGSRFVLAVLDDSGGLLSASDAVLHRMDPGGRSGTSPLCDAAARIHQDSVGGRFEADGSFRGTRWHSEAVDQPGTEHLDWHSTPSAPSDADIAALKGLVTELIRRGPLP